MLPTAASSSQDPPPLVAGRRAEGASRPWSTAQAAAAAHGHTLPGLRGGRETSVGLVDREGPRRTCQSPLRRTSTNGADQKVGDGCTSLPWISSLRGLSLASPSSSGSWRWAGLKPSWNHSWAQASPPWPARWHLSSASQSSWSGVRCSSPKTSSTRWPQQPGRRDPRRPGESSVTRRSRWAAGTRPGAAPLVSLLGAREGMGDGYVRR